MCKHFSAFVFSALLFLAACAAAPTPTPIPPTIDPKGAETRIAASIFATQTASVPTTTNTPFPTITPVNPFQSDIDAVISGDPRNAGIVVFAYPSQSDLSTLIFDLQSIAGTNAPLDVFRVLLQFAQIEASKTFKELWLCYKGTFKFRLDGAYFKQLGEEYSWQNPVYTARTFPSHLQNSDGSAAYSEWTGGLLGVTTKQMEDFNDFHKRWYLNELVQSMPTPIDTRSTPTTEQTDTPSKPTLSPDDAIRLLDWTNYLSDTGNYIYIDGELQNMSSEPMSFIEITVKMLDDSGKLIATESGYADVQLLGPGEKTTFKIMTSYRTGIKSFVIANIQWKWAGEGTPEALDLPGTTPHRTATVSATNEADATPNTDASKTATANHNETITPSLTQLPQGTLSGEEGGLKLTISEITRSTSIGRRTASPGKIFVVMNATLENLSLAKMLDTLPVDVGPSNFTLKGDSGVVYRETSIPAPDPQFAFDVIEIGEKVRGYIGFEVAEDETNLILRYSVSPAGWGGNYPMIKIPLSSVSK